VRRSLGNVPRAGGVETEAEIAFAALSDLPLPVVEVLAALPVPQSAALAAALALGPPQPGDRLAVCVATLVLLQASGRRPVLVVDDGASNREVGAELFLAPKTVEFHWRQIYRRLGVRSWSQLAATLARQAPPEPPASA
jgi:hypothetical protein